MVQKSQKNLFLRIRIPFQTKYMPFEINKISAIIPFYPYVLYRQEAMISVSSQGIEKLEFIVINDKSERIIIYDRYHW